MPSILNSARSFFRSVGLPCNDIDETHVGTHFGREGRYYRALVSEQVDNRIATGVLVIAGLGKVPRGELSSFAVAALALSRTGVGKVMLDDDYIMLTLDLLGGSGSYN